MENHSMNVSEYHDIRNVGLCSGRPVKNKKMFFVFLFWNFNWELKLGLKLE